MEHEVAKRVNESITRPLEKKILLYFASKMHNSISPDHLTYLGLFGSLVILLGYFLVISDMVSYGWRVLDFYQLVW